MNMIHMVSMDTNDNGYYFGNIMAVKWLWLTSKHWLYDNDIGANYSHGTGGNVTFKTYNNHTDTCGDHFNGDYSLSMAIQTL